MSLLLEALKRAERQKKAVQPLEEEPPTLPPPEFQAPVVAALRDDPVPAVLPEPTVEATPVKPTVEFPMERRRVPREEVPAIADPALTLAPLEISPLDIDLLDAPDHQAELDIPTLTTLAHPPSLLEDQPARDSGHRLPEITLAVEEVPLPAPEKTLAPAGPPVLAISMEPSEPEPPPEIPAVHVMPVENMERAAQTAPAATPAPPEKVPLAATTPSNEPPAALPLPQGSSDIPRQPEPAVPPPASVETMPPLLQPVAEHQQAAQARGRDVLKGLEKKPRLDTRQKRLLLLGGAAFLIAAGTAGALFWLQQEFSAPQYALPPPMTTPATSAPAEPPPPAPPSPAGDPQTNPVAADAAAPAAPMPDHAVAAPAHTESRPEPSRERGANNITPNVAPAIQSVPATRSSRSAEPRSPAGVSRNNVSREVESSTAAGYRALSQGDLAAARGSYQISLNKNATDRDALLGLANIAQREGRSSDAAGAYERLLLVDSRDIEALAGLALIRGTADPLAYEARLRNLLSERGENASAIFALGTLLARQNRWGEAQDAFFRVVTLAPRVAAYQFNLAVSLDHLGQYALARTYYRAALTLAGNSPAAFPAEAAHERLQAIEELLQ